MRRLKTIAKYASLIFLCTTSLSLADVTISSPQNGATVCASESVEGTKSPLPAPGADQQIYIVINPIATPGDYWVQSPGSIQSEGNWSVSVNFGRPGLDVGAQFQLRAFVDPATQLNEGDQLTTWPHSIQSSGIIKVKRKKC